MSELPSTDSLHETVPMQPLYAIARTTYTLVFSGYNQPVEIRTSLGTPSRALNRVIEVKFGTPRNLTALREIITFVQGALT